MDKDIKVDKTIYELLQVVRYEISRTDLKKSGHNGFQNFDYFELKDFVPTATKMFAQVGICPMFYIEYLGDIEYAYLALIKGVEKIVFKVPTAEPAGNNPIQNLGSKITYLRRYLYLIALDLVENDSVDSQDNSKIEKKVEPKITPEQIDQIVTLYDEENIEKMCKYYKVKALSDLTIVQASQAINKKLKENANG